MSTRVHALDQGAFFAVLVNKARTIESLPEGQEDVYTHSTVRFKFFSPQMLKNSSVQLLQQVYSVPSLALVRIFCTVFILTPWERMPHG